jgi:hypothetical protein
MLAQGQRRQASSQRQRILCRCGRGRSGNQPNGSTLPAQAHSRGTKNVPLLRPRAASRSAAQEQREKKKNRRGARALRATRLARLGASRAAAVRGLSGCCTPHATSCQRSARACRAAASDASARSGRAGGQPGAVRHGTRLPRAGCSARWLTRQRGGGGWAFARNCSQNSRPGDGDARASRHAPRAAVPPPPLRRVPRRCA